MKKPLIKIKFQNGLSFSSFKADVFDVNDISEIFDFEQSDNPDFIVFGPYGNDIPAKGNYIRVGYFCENITPDLSICEWAFGIPHEGQINNPNYNRIQWHGFNPNLLLKNLTDNDIDRIINQKKKFCNFLYSHHVPYREEFFRQLSKYKKVDAPGISMNNMSSIDTQYQGNVWDRKRQFLSNYKFSIAFENYAYPGYQTEKLYDAMQVNSIPIYCGDDRISKIFNTKSFLNTPDFVTSNKGKTVSFLEKYSQLDFVDIRPQFYRLPNHRIIRKLKSIGRNLKMSLQFSQLDFKPLIEQIIEIDKNEDLYVKYLKEPWFNDNIIPSDSFSKNAWLNIFNG